MDITELERRCFLRDGQTVEDMRPGLVVRVFCSFQWRLMEQIGVIPLVLAGVFTPCIRDVGSDFLPPVEYRRAADGVIEIAEVDSLIATQALAKPG